MPRIVSVWLEHWPVTRLKRARARPSESGASGASDDGPMVVAAMEANGLRLIAVDPFACALGLAPGETLARARARIGTPIAVHPADPEADAAALHRLCLWAKRYTPVVAPFGPAEGRDGFFLDIAGASHLLGGEAALLADLARRLAEHAIPARIALADTPACAFALARHGGGGLVAPPVPDETTGFTHPTGSAGPLSRKERDRVRCGPSPESAHTSPQPSPSRRGGTVAPLADDRSLVGIRSGDAPRRSPKGANSLVCQDSDSRGVLNLPSGGRTAPYPGEHWRGPHILVPVGGNARALHALPVAALRLDPATAQALARLGLRRIGDLAAAPRAPLARRFGEALLLRLDQALGHRPEPLVTTGDPRDFQAARGFLEPIGQPETIVATATRLMEELAPRLDAAGLGARALRLSLTRVDGVVRTLDLGMSLPIRCPAQVARLLALRLDRLGPALDAGFGFETVELAVTATGTIAAHQGILVEAPGAAEGAEHLGDALRQRIGRRMMRLGFRASHLPEQAGTGEPWRTGRPNPDGSVPRLPPRPLVLLRRGEVAEDVIALAPDGPPHRFRWRRRVHRVAHADGPERIADEWWRAPGPTRDYYVVEDEAGRRLWVYREGFLTRDTPTRWFVHGLFA